MLHPVRVGKQGESSRTTTEELTEGMVEFHDLPFLAANLTDSWL